MAILRLLAHLFAWTVRAAHALARGGVYALSGGRKVAGFTGRRVNVLRDRGGAGDTGMIRLLDLHAASCAGDTLIAIGLAGTIFFNVPTDEARGKVALYLIVTMAPFALLAPIVGPLLDRFRHGRRWALAATMLGRAFLAWVISDQMQTIGLYPAAFGILVLSRAYGVARSAAVPRLLPGRLGLVEAGARASLFGLAAGGVAAVVGIAAGSAGPQWTLRLGTVVFLCGMVIALRLPPRADSDPPETVPRIMQLPGRRSLKVLSGRLVWAALTGSAVLRGLYGFLTLFLAFRIREGDFTLRLGGTEFPQQVSLAVVIGGLAVGSFVATAVCTRLKIHRPMVLQAATLVLVAAAAVAATLLNSVLLVALFCLLGAFASGMAKHSVDAVIQERLPERVWASAFAHSETLLMLAWVFGAAIGLVPFGSRAGLALATTGIVLAAARAGLWAWQLRRERLRGLTGGPDDTVRLDEPAPSDKTEPPTVRLDPKPTGAPTRRPGDPDRTAEMPGSRQPVPDDEPTAPLAPPGYHLYRPSSRRDDSNR